MGGGELPDAVEEVADHQELIVGVARQEVPGAADEVAEDFLVPGGGGLCGLHYLAATVAWIGSPADVPGLLQAVQDGGDTAARDEEVFGDLIRGTQDLLAGYTDDELLVIRDFLDRVRQLTAAHADGLGSYARTGPGNAETTRHGRS